MSISTRYTINSYENMLPGTALLKQAMSVV